jgi:heme/copper-type cytochrome/quinol oxidase subunit 2
VHQGDLTLCYFKSTLEHTRDSHTTRNKIIIIIIIIIITIIIIIIIKFMSAGECQV